MSFLKSEYKIKINNEYFLIPVMEDKDTESVIKEKTLYGMDGGVRDNYTNGDTIAICDDFYKDNTIFFPCEVKTGVLKGTDPKTGKLIVNVNGANEEYTPEQIIDLASLKKITSPTRGNAIASIIGASTYSDQRSNVIIKVSSILVVALIVAAIVFKTLLPVFGIAAIGLIMNNAFNNHKDMSNIKDVFRKKMLLFASYRAAAISLGLVPNIGEDAETKDTVIDYFVSDIVARGDAVKDIINAN